MLRILHIEDDALDALVIDDALRHSERVELERVDTLAAAHVRLSVPHNFNVLLVDLSPHDTKNMESIVALGVYGLPIIAISVESSSGSFERAVEAGADDYIVKSGMNSDQLACRIRFVRRHYARQGEAVTKAVNLAILSKLPFKRKITLTPEIFEALKPFIDRRDSGS